MIAPPSALLAEYKKCLQNSGIAVRLHTSFLKWFRFYWDFCLKYQREPGDYENLASFIGKLNDKKQTVAQQAEAKAAIAIFFKALRHQAKKTAIEQHPMNQANPDRHARTPCISTEGQGPLQNLAHHPFTPHASPPDKTSRSSSNESTQLEVHIMAEASTGLKLDASTDNSTSSSWVREFNRMREEIALRHYSPKTLRSYLGWMRKFQAFTKSKPPATLSTEDVKEFLTHLAVKKSVSASTQNQAFNALLFVFRHVMRKEFGKIEGVVRAKRSKYIPVIMAS